MPRAALTMVNLSWATQSWENRLPQVGSRSTWCKHNKTDQGPQQNPAKIQGLNQKHISSGSIRLGQRRTCPSLLAGTRAGHKILNYYRATAFDSSDAKPCIECSRPCPLPSLLMAAKVLQTDGCKPHTVIVTTGCRPSLRFCRHRRKGRAYSGIASKSWNSLDFGA